MTSRWVAITVLLVGGGPDLWAGDGQQSEVAPAPQTSTPTGAVKPSAGDTSAQSMPSSRMGIPAWARDARWHQIVVSKFRNGEPANDPPGCLPWTATPPAMGAASGQSPERKRRADSDKDGMSVHSDVDTREFGGDLQGLQAKLSYLRKLGVNTLYLSSIFQPVAGGTTGARRDSRTSGHSRTSGDSRTSPTVDMRHVDDSLGVAKGRSEKGFSHQAGETGDPKTWKFSASDRVFLGLLKEAHALGLRVVLEGKFADLATPAGSTKDLESHAFAITTRWMDPDGDGDPSDGIDGWVVSAGGDFWRRTGRMWRIHARRTNPNAVVVGDLRSSPLGQAAAADFDLVMGYDLGEGVRRFFAGAAGTRPLQQFVDELSRMRERYGPADSDNYARVILPLGGPQMGRMLSAIAPPTRGGATRGTDGATRGRDHSKSGEAELDRWRLAAVFQHFYAAAPMTFYGDEVGMHGSGVGSALAPMWWNDLSDAASKSPDYRGDFLVLTRMLNALRDQYASLRHGVFQPVLLDEGRHIFAFRRALASEEAIIVINYGDTNYKVKLPARRPGQLVRVIHPQLKAVPSRRRGELTPAKIDHTKIVRLRVGGTKQIANQRGEMSLWVAPMSVRIALLNDEE